MTNSLAIDLPEIQFGTVALGKSNGGRRWADMVEDEQRDRSRSPPAFIHTQEALIPAASEVEFQPAHSPAATDFVSATPPMKPAVEFFSCR